MHENETPESIQRQCRDPGDRVVRHYTKPEGMDWLLGWALASSIFRSLLGAGHWQQQPSAATEYRCAVDQCCAPSTLHPNGGSGLTVEFWPHFLLLLFFFFPCTIFWVTTQESQWKNGFTVAGCQRSPGLGRELGATALVQVADGWEIVILLKRESQTAQPGAQLVSPPQGTIAHFP